MKRLLVLLAGALLLALVVAGAAAAGPARTCPSAPHQVTTFSPGDWGAFAGGMAADSHGKLFVSQTTWAESNIGEVWKVAPNGDKSLAGTMDLGPNGMLVGVAVDRLDRVYVAFVDFGDPQTVGGGVYCVGPGGTMTMKVSLPADTFTFPNGLAIHRDRVYITDSATGAVWCSKLGNGVAKPADPWVQDALLAPGDPADPEMRGMGANGIAFQGECLFVNVSDYGRIVRIRVKDNGSPGVPSVICERPELKTADNMAFDALGGLWIATDTGTTGASPSGGLYRLSPGAGLRQVADDPGWLNYPTAPVFGTTAGTQSTLFILNGAYFSDLDLVGPDVQALRVGVPGLRLF